MNYENLKMVEFDVSEIKFEKDVAKTIILKFKDSKEYKNYKLTDVLEEFKDVFQEMPNYDKKIHKICFVFLDKVEIIETEKEMIINQIEVK